MHRSAGLEGRVAVVTGAGSMADGLGNGRAITLALAAESVRVVAVDRNLAALNETGQLLETAGVDYLLAEADVTSSADCERAVQLAVSRWGRLDILVNNVGIAGPAGTAVDVDLDAWDECWRINVTSMVLMSRAAIPHLQKAGGGSIVNISSLLGIRGGHPALAYPTTKAAIVGMTKAMAVHHGPDGIRVNAVAPGFVYTPMVFSQGIDDTTREQRRSISPLGTEGTAWDTADSVVFLASDRSRWITGTVLSVDAGVAAIVGMSRAMSVTSAPED